MSKNEFKDPERIISMLTAIARLEFNYKLDTTDDSSIENVIAVGLNTLSESLETSVVDAARFKKSENRFKAIAQNVPQYFSYVDKNLCYQFVNNTYIKEFKIKRGEIIGKSMESFLGASFFNKIKPFIDRAISGEELKFETVFNSPIKGKMHVNITYVPDIDESEEVVGLFILINDRTAFEIEQREKNIYEQFFNSSIDLLYVANLDGYFIKINNAFENLLGWTNDEIMDRPFIDFVHPDDKEKTREEFNKYISNRHQSIGFENRYLKKNGGWVWIHWNALASSGGEELFAIGRDVTNQKNQEEKLEQINKTYLKLFNYASIGIFIIDVKTNKILNVNRQGAQQIGYQPKELEGKPLSDLYHKNTLEQSSNLLRGYDNIQVETKHISKSGNLVPVEISSRKLIISGHEVYQSFVRDITKQSEFKNQLTFEQKQSHKFQSQLLSSQLNPHFIFNVLNSFQYYLLNKDLEESLEFISRFSSIMRSVLENSTHEFISCEDEILFLQRYLSLSQERNIGKFDFSIKHCNKFDPKSQQIPPMLIQPFIENSIIHGFSDIKNGGLLDIYFKIKNNRVIINVSDNGVGRELGKKSKKMKKGNIGTSMGLSLIHGRINLLNELYKKKFTVSISDRLIDNQTAGTEVEIVYDMFN